MSDTLAGFLASYANIIDLCLLNALVGYGVFLALSGNMFTLATGGFMALGAYGSVYLTTELDLAFAPAVLAGATLAGLAALLIGAPVLRLRGDYFMLATFAFTEVVRVIALNWDSVTGGAIGIVNIPRHTQTWQLLVLLAVGIGLIFGLRRSYFGRAITTIKQDDVIAEAMGVNVFAHRLTLFVASGVVSGGAGALAAHMNFFIGPSDFGLGRSVDALAYPILGGVDALLGPLVGAVFTTLLPEVLRFSNQLREILMGALVVAVVLYLPGGAVSVLRPVNIGARRGLAGRTVSSPAALALEGIAKRFQGIVAVERVSFEAKAGEVTGLIGPNGSGKTTTMNMITGLYAADAGRITLDRIPIGGLPAHRIAALGVARTFQNIRLLPGETCLTNVLVGTHRAHRASVPEALLGLPRAGREEKTLGRRAKALLDEVGIGHLAGTRAGGLSYGDRRRVEIARALATEPRLLLLDEPAAGMNHAERGRLAQLIGEIRGRGVTVLLIEHDIELVCSVSDHVVVLNFGREIAEGAPEEVRRLPAVIEAYLGTDEHA